MRCASCDRENPEAAKFCLECGTAFGMGCGACGAELPPESRFCLRCGEAVTSDALRASDESVAARSASERTPLSYTPRHLVEKVLTSRSALEGERKRVTVLLADVKSSVGLSEGVDPEDWHRIMDRFFAILAGAVHRYEGTVNQYTGDGIMALFGAPIAHEDHPQRACHAALELTSKLREYAEELKRTLGLAFSVRTGIHSGEVVVGKIGDDLRMDYTAQGHTVGLAARMEQLAEPGGVYLTDTTAQQVAGYFELRDLGEFRLRGVTEPVRVHELGGVGKLRTRLDVARERGLSRFVGRGDEMARLESALAHAEAGNGRVVGIVGEAGVGKSRLCQVFLERCRARGIATFESHGVPYGKSVPFLPMVELFRSFYGVTESDPPALVRERVAGRVLLLDESFRDVLPAVFDLMAVAEEGRGASTLDPEQAQKRLHQLCRRLIQAGGEQGLGVTLFEDLHWFDGASDAFVEALVDAFAGTRGLVVLNFRPEYQARWMARSYYEQIPVAALDADAISEMLDGLLGPDPSLVGLSQRLCERTAGNPFFTEEVVWDLVETGKLVGESGAYRLTGPVEDVPVPERVHSILAARIDRLAEREKRALQTASVIGKDFPVPLLRELLPNEESELESALAALEAAEMIYEAAIHPEVEYAFRHPLTRDVAYETLLRDRRIALHADLARALEGVEGAEERAALIAYHWEAASEKLDAARWHARAAGRATLDQGEVMRHWKATRELARALPRDDETAELEIAGALGMVGLGWQLGLSFEEMDRVFDETQALAESRDDLGTQIMLRVASGPSRGQAGDLRSYVRLAAEAVALAKRSGLPEYQLAAHRVMSFAHTFDGDVRQALEHSATAEGLEASVDESAQARNTLGFDELFFRGAWLGFLLIGSGRLAEAREKIEWYREEAPARSSASQILSLQSSCMLAQATGATDEALDYARTAVDLAERAGTTFFKVVQYFSLGRALVDLERFEEALPAFETALALIAEHRVALPNQPSILAGLARCRAELGDLDAARQLLDERRRSQGPLEASFADEIGMDVTRAMLLCGGADVADEIAGELAGGEERVAASGRLSDLGELHECRAVLALSLGDEAGYRRQLGLARDAHRETGATGHQARIERLLGAPGAVESGPL